MGDRNEKILQELLKISGNSICADCDSENVEWASYNLGIFLCVNCVSAHRNIDPRITKVKNLKLDHWEDSQVDRMRQVGNLSARAKYESRVPLCYRRPKENDPVVLREQWIRAKYEREEFTDAKSLKYTSGKLEGYLMKKGKKDCQYFPRKFVLSEADNTLRYYVKENKEPKCTIKLSELNVVLAPQKMQDVNSMQLTFCKDELTRHIYLTHSSSETINNWYMAIRCTKLHNLQQECPTASEEELLARLTWDFTKEGWLWKRGPRMSDAYKKRWFTLDNRRLLYHADPFDAYPKGEIYLEEDEESYSVSENNADGSVCREAPFPFFLRTPKRIYCLSASSSDEREAWMYFIHCGIRET